MWENIQFKKDYKLKSESESLYVSFQKRKQKLLLLLLSFMASKAIQKCGKNWTLYCVQRCKIAYQICNSSHTLHAIYLEIISKYSQNICKYVMTYLYCKRYSAWFSRILGRIFKVAAISVTVGKSGQMTFCSLLSSYPVLFLFFSSKRVHKLS